MRQTALVLKGRQSRCDKNKISATSRETWRGYFPPRNRVGRGILIEKFCKEEEYGFHKYGPDSVQTL